MTSTFLDIAPPTVAVTSPNGGELLNVGQQLQRHLDGRGQRRGHRGRPRAVAHGRGRPVSSPSPRGIANSGTFSWLVTVPATTHALIRATAHDAAGHTTQDLSDAEFSIAGGAGVDDGPVTEFALSPVWPNPVRGSTRFQFALPQEARVHLSVHDVQGRELLVLADGSYPAGRHTSTGRRLQALVSIQACTSSA